MAHAKVVHTDEMVTAIGALRLELRRFHHHVGVLRRDFGAVLADPEGIVSDINVHAYTAVKAKCAPSSIRAMYSPKMLHWRGLDAIRRQQTEQRFLDQFSREFDLGHRRARTEGQE